MAIFPLFANWVKMVPETSFVDPLRAKTSPNEFDNDLFRLYPCQLVKIQLFGPFSMVTVKPRCNKAWQNSTFLGLAGQRGLCHNRPSTRLTASKWGGGNWVERQKVHTEEHFEAITGGIEAWKECIGLSRILGVVYEKRYLWKAGSSVQGLLQ